MVDIVTTTSDYNCCDYFQLTRLLHQSNLGGQEIAAQNF
jgi:hypothetical protein